MTNNTDLSNNPLEPWIHPWPEYGLEAVTRCPICGGSSADTIYLAYENYYTHTQAREKVSYESLSRFRKLRQSLINGYTNWRYATRATPFSWWGVVIVMLLPNLRAPLDRKFRHLPRFPPNGGRLLDVGCGNGAFLDLAKSCGWEVAGLDPDPVAVEYCKKRQLSVETGGFEVFSAQSEIFDVITLSHVIEHTPNPVQVLCACHALLKPGGQLWLETPNIESIGHSRFQRHWRGLEIPRHLVLLSRGALRQAMIEAGFQPPHDLACPNAPLGMFLSSHAIARAQTAPNRPHIPGRIRLEAIFASIFGKFLPSRREFLTIITRRP